MLASLRAQAPPGVRPPAGAGPQRRAAAQPRSGLRDEQSDPAPANPNRAGDVLISAFRHLSLDLPTPFFAPHTRSSSTKNHERMRHQAATIIGNATLSNN